MAEAAKKAILYARVSGEEQAKKGFSLSDQRDSLRRWAEREGYEVIEELADEGWSGAYLQRPGLDRVRELVAAGGVSVVATLFRDRLARGVYAQMLKEEFAAHGTRLIALNIQLDDSPEGDLQGGIMDQFAAYERAKIAERTRRGKLQKARQGKILRNSRAHYGFRHDEAGEAYVVNEDEMAVVRRIFREVAEGSSLHSIKRALDLEGVPTPNGGRYWGPSYLRTLVLEDVYRPHSYAEVKELVSQDVAARLDASRSYGVFWSNRTFTTRKRVPETNGGERGYRWRYSVQKNPREDWIAIPVPDAGLSRALVDAARLMVADNRRRTNKGRRFFELGGLVYCGGCGKRMQHSANLSRGRIYPYYKCRRVVRDGRDACPDGGSRPNHRAEELEGRIWGFVSDLMKNPEQLREDLERMVEFERRELRADPDREAKAWLEKLAEADRMRSGYQDLAAKGLMTPAELGEKLEGLKETREAAERELEALRSRRDRIERLERDTEEVLNTHAVMAPEALNGLSAKERHQLYRLLRLKVIVNAERDLEISGALGTGFVQTETVPR
ncbi:MAG: recombinase family protein [Actinomycetota bacterium]|nr:recombinase family protein [Actinomycetota bacterium]